MTSRGDGSLDELRKDLRGRLDALRDRDRLRELAAPVGIDFSSNDYLGLSSDPEFQRRVREAAADGPLTQPSSRLLRGQSERHDTVEARLAEFKGADAALIYPTGYQANLGLLTALLQPGDRVISDALNHACLIDGMRLARSERRIVPHLDVDAIEAELARSWTSGRTWLVTESLFSMDGDVAPLDRYAELTERYGAQLIVDDAHAAGLFGERGSGLVEAFGVENRVAAVTTTFGKALGGSGAVVTGSTELRDWLINTSRPFVFTTATPDWMLHTIDVALDFVRDQPERRERAHALADKLRHRLSSLGAISGAGRGPIIPVVLGEDGVAVSVAEQLQADGYDVRAVRPPTVPEGQARLRLSVHADRSDEELDGLTSSLMRALMALSA